VTPQFEASIIILEASFTLIYLSKLGHAEMSPVAGLSLGDRLQLLVDVDILRAADGEGEGVGVVAPLDVDGAVDADAGVDIGELRPRL
jgi:hypothetical protein